MTETPTTITRDRILAVGLLAIAQHQLEHHLPAPASLDLPYPGDDAPLTIRVRLFGLHVQTAWLNTVTVHDETNEPRLARGARGAGYMATTWAVTLGDGLTRVHLTGTRPMPVALLDGPKVVSA